MLDQHNVGTGPQLIYKMPPNNTDLVEEPFERKVELKIQRNEEEEIKPLYPKAVLFILGFKFFERFFMQSLRNMLVLYLTSEIGFSEKNAAIIYHCHSALIFLMGILGAIIADSWLGNFWTVLHMNIIGMISMIVFVLYAAPQIGLPYRAGLTVLSLMVLSCANGSLKPCVAALGAEQFKLPDQKDLLGRYFAKFYFTVKLSAVIGSIVLPILRSDIPSIGPSDGYLLSFGVALAIAVISFVVFVGGLPFYTKVKSDGNMLVKMAKCIWSAIAVKYRNVSRSDSNIHWLDYASSEHSRELVEDTKIFLNIVVLFLPIPMFWALNEQTASMFPLQATRMNGYIGFYTVKPDQLQLLMQILVTTLLPLFEIVLYPMMAKIGINSPLQKLGIGGFLSASAFVAAGSLEVMISQNDVSSVHMAWVLPHFVMLAAAETMVGVTGLSFANMQAPTSLKTVMLAMWLSTHAMGNVINVVVFSVGQFSDKASLFFLFAVLMYVDMMIFVYLAKRYKCTSNGKSVDK